MITWETIERVLLLGSTTAAVGVVILLATGRNAAGGAERTGEAVDVAWDSLLAGGQRTTPGMTGDPIVVFADFQCPACKYLAEVSIPGAERLLGRSIAVVYYHWPLPYHEHAMAAAQFAECAADQGQFASAYRLLYANQDSLEAILSAGGADLIAGVDQAAFATCLRDPAVARRIDRQAELAKRLGGRGTPVVLVNGRRWPGAPDSTRLSEMIASGT